MAELTRDHIVWAYRLLLDRDPESEAVITPKLHGYASTEALRRDLLTSPEFAAKNPDVALANERTIVIKPLPSGLRIFVDLADQAIGLPIVRGAFEQAELACALRLARPGEVAIDGGAHVGLFALHLAQAVGSSGHVHAFEPFPGNADLLESSVAENQFADRLTVHRVALGASSGIGRINFATHTPNSGGAFLIPAGADGLPGHERMEVQVVALDDVKIEGRVGCIKLDVEGAEPLVLAGASKLLARDRPSLLAEIHHEQLRRVAGQSAEDLFAALGRLGYAPREIAHDGSLGARLPHPPTAPVSTVAFVPV